MIKIEVYTDGTAFIEGKTQSGKPLAQSHNSLQEAAQEAAYHAYKQEGKDLYKVQGVCVWYEPGCTATNPLSFPEFIGADDTDDNPDD